MLTIWLINLLKMEPFTETRSLPDDELFNSSNFMQENNGNNLISMEISSRGSQSFRSPGFAKESPTRLIERIEQNEAAELELEKRETDVQFLIGFADELFSLKEANMRKRLTKNESKIREIFKSQGCDYEKIMNS